MTEASAAVSVLRDRGITQPVTFGIILGTGLASVGDVVENAIHVSYADLPGFPQTGVSGHAGKLTVGSMEGLHVAILQGRSHYYEAGNAAAMRVPLETFKALGVQSVMITNSAGSLNLDWHPGTLALISDHINFAGPNPLVGIGGDGRFVNMAEAYDKRLRARLRRAAMTAGTNALKEGVYMWFPGPSFETPAEIKAAKMLGADLVGMSTVPEVILARYLDMKVLGLSVVTNFGTGINAGNPSHAETKDMALSSTIALKRILRAFLRDEATGHA